MPARKHFKPGYLAGFKIDLRFVEWHKFAARNAAANAVFELAAESQFALHLGFVPIEPVLSGLFGVVHGDIRHVQQLLGACVGFCAKSGAGKPQRN